MHLLFLLSKFSQERAFRLFLNGGGNLFCVPRGEDGRLLAETEVAVGLALVFEEGCDPAFLFLGIVAFCERAAVYLEFGFGELKNR